MTFDGPTAGELQDKVVLVSGGPGRGGRRRPRRGCRRCECRRDRPAGRRCEAAAAELRALGGEDARFVPADITDVEQARGSVHRTVEAYRRIDCLVNAAGLTSRGTLLDTTPELFDQHIAANLRGPFFLMQAAVQDMRRRGEPGTIVNVLTMSAHGGQPYLRRTSRPRRAWPG